MKDHCLSCAAGLLLGLLAQTAFGQFPVTVERNVPATMRDGTVLRADIYHPNKAGKFPVLLQRTPYDRRGATDFAYRAAASDYVVVVQDVRGRYASEGTWTPFEHESADGYDTIEWAGALPYSDGRVGMFGGSYVGATQMLAAIAHPPHLAGICPFVTASNYHDGWTYQGGAFEQWFNESWTSGLAQDTLDREVKAETNALVGAPIQPLSEYPLFQLPADSTALSRLAPYFLDWLAHPNYDEYWKRWSIEEHYGDIAVPALTTAAWYDIFLGGSLRNYQGLKARAHGEAARNGQHLLVTIGGHSGSGRKIGDVDFGPHAAEFDENQVTVAWYDFLFKGVRNQFARKPVQLFVMGANVWRDEDDWPLSRARNKRFFLHSSGHANSASGDGTLSTQSSSDTGPDGFADDPSNPVPTTGGPLCCDTTHLAPGPKDQKRVEARQDVLVYSSAPLDRDTEVTGPVILDAFVASSGTEADFTAKLVDVAPDGFTQNLTEGILRAQYRDSASAPEALRPGRIYEVKIDLIATSNVFRAGHRIRLEVSSSNFPRFDRNPAAGQPITNRIYHDAEHPSALLLPLVPER